MQNNKKNNKNIMKAEDHLDCIYFEGIGLSILQRLKKIEKDADGKRILFFDTRGYEKIIKVAVGFTHHGEGFVREVKIKEEDFYTFYRDVIHNTCSGEETADIHPTVTMYGHAYNEGEGFEYLYGFGSN
jgi:hypothetical protein